MAQIVSLLGYGGQCFAEKVLGWNRCTIRKGLAELKDGVAITDKYSHCGRKRAEEHFPNLLTDIESIVDSSSQVDPTFRSKRIYSPLTANEIHRRLQTNKGYKPSELPTVRTVRTKLNQLGIRPQRVKKCEPIRKIPETDAIFEQVSAVNENADKDRNAIRISIDCKAVVKIGPFSRGGKNRIEQKASDHDFQPEQTLVPFGIFIPEFCESHVWFSIGPVTADFMVDRLQELWEKFHKRFPNLAKLVINADNGPESNGLRTRWLQRIVQFSDRANITIELAYYPPYHSKYNPVERLWGVLENHWRGELLTSTDKSTGPCQNNDLSRHCAFKRKIGQKNLS